ncbi:MAG: DUF3124 domain-containing protein [Cyanobacteria bacterium RI_101]|nr:DUF3124 domain-containing protein [Cyanobacteria bacterium RI_101]
MNKGKALILGLCCCLLWISACGAVGNGSAPVESGIPPLTERPGVTPLAPEALPALKTGQIIYVPVYSEVYDANQARTLQLAATLSFRNTDLSRVIVIETIDYYDSGGQKIRSYLNQPLALAPLASLAVVVEREDRAGGVGANFIVEWRADQSVSPPIAEAVMIGTASQQGLSWASPGRVVRERRASESSK